MSTCGARVTRVVEWMPEVGRAIVFEDVTLQTVEGHGLEEPRRHDPVGVDVVAVQRQAPAAGACDGQGGRTAHAGTPSSIVRTSTTSPAMAAAATIAGLISSVRPVGLPMRPLKFRFDDDAHI